MQAARVDESYTSLLTAMAAGREASFWVMPKSPCRCQSKEIVQLNQVLRKEIMFSVGSASPFTLLRLAFFF